MAAEYCISISSSYFDRHTDIMKQAGKPLNGHTRKSSRLHSRIGKSLDFSPPNQVARQTSKAINWFVLYLALLALGSLPNVRAQLNLPLFFCHRQKFPPTWLKASVDSSDNAASYLYSSNLLILRPWRPDNIPWDMSISPSSLDGTLQCRLLH